MMAAEKQDLWEVDSGKRPFHSVRTPPDPEAGEVDPRDLLEVEFTLAGKTLTTNVFEDLVTNDLGDPMELREKMDRAPALFAFWAEVEVQAFLANKELKRDYDMWLADKKREARRRIEDKRPTDKAVLEAVMFYERDAYYDWQGRLDHAEADEMRAHQMTRAWALRCQSLPSVNKNLTSLWEGPQEGIRIMEDSKK